MNRLSLSLLDQIMKTFKLAQMWNMTDIEMCRTRNQAKRQNQDTEQGKSQKGGRKEEFSSFLNRTRKSKDKMDSLDLEEQGDYT